MKAKINKNKATVVVKTKIEDPVYEDIKVCKDTLHMCDNDAYNL